MPVEIIGLALLAWLLALAITPLMRALAHRCGVLDRPDPTRKLHSSAVALGGGVAVLLAAVLAMGLVFAVSPSLQALFIREAKLLWIVMAGSVSICMLGLFDDAWSLRGRQKLVGQVLISLLMIGCGGLLVKQITLFHPDPIVLGVAAIPFTVIWMLAAINAVNLLDGSDGMAATVGIIACIAVAIMAWFNNNPAVAAIAAAMAGALAGFLVFNFPPASIYLGDAGSMMIGLVLGVLAIQASLKGPATVAMAAPLALLAIPIFDSAAALLRRTLTGRSIYATDRAHLHHNLLQRGLSRRGTLLVVALLCTATGAGAFISVALRNEMMAVLSVVVVFASLIAGRVFGYAEASLLMNRIVHFGGSLMAGGARRDGSVIRQQQVHLQGSRNWDQLWATISEFATEHDLYGVRMDLNLPWLHEGYNAVWERRQFTKGQDTWQLQVPLMADHRQAGRVVMTGGGDSAPYSLIAKACDMLESMAPTIAELCQESSELELQPISAISGLRPHIQQHTARNKKGGATVTAN